MANTIQKDLTTRASFTTTPNDKVVSLWIGDSVCCGAAEGPTSDIIDPGTIYPAELTDIAKYWDKWGTAADASAARLTFVDTKAGGGAAAWANVLKAGGGVSGNLAHPAPYYGGALYHAGNGGAAFTPHVDHVSTTKHHTVVLGISSSALNDDVASIATPLAHWDPAVDNGAFELVTEHYIQPAFANLQTSSGVVYLDAVYIHAATDAFLVDDVGYPLETAELYGYHLLRLIEGLERFLEFPGIPVCIVRTPGTPADFPWAKTIRTAQTRVAQSRPRTYLLDTRKYAQGIGRTHLTGMASVQLGYDAAELVRTSLPNQWANITKAF
jgi:hypothetical protein